jgi:ParB family chromosome partitioning protein
MEEVSMTLRTIALSELYPAKANPRRRVDREAIAGLAESIKTDGVLQNLVVEKEGDGKFRVISGSRRYLALRLLKHQRAIDGSYKVPVEIRTLTPEEALRIATVENVQRAELDPIDEADAFARLLQNGTTLDELSGRTGLSTRIIRRRVALSDLCKEVKAAVQKGDISLRLAESLTLGTHQQQRSLLKDIRAGVDLDGDQVREMLCSEKPSVAIAIFPLEKYLGTYTSDLFAEQETTYFDDAEQFMALQQEAVDTLAEKYRKKTAWVDVFHSFSAPWWQYHDAEKGEAAGVVINLKPNGRVEIKKRQARHEVEEEVAAITEETPEAPKPRSAVSAALARSAALHKSIAVQAALLQNPRKAMEVSAVSLLLAFVPEGRIRIAVHPCVTAWDGVERKPRALEVVLAQVSRITNSTGLLLDSRGRLSGEGSESDISVMLYQRIQTLSDEELARLILSLIILSFGQADVETIDTEESLFNRVAINMSLAMRDWWIPDEEFLSLMRKDQLKEVAIKSGASRFTGRLNSKKDLIASLVGYFDRTADPKAVRDEHDNQGHAWLPAIMAFPASTPADHS